VTSLRTGEFAVRVTFFGRLVRAAHPATEQQRPERRCARDDEQSKTPRAVCGVRINLAGSKNYKRQGESQATRQINSQRDKKCSGDHFTSTFLSDFNSALSEQLIIVRMTMIAPSTIKSWTLGFISVSIMSAAMRNSKPSNRY
jgi:hypothetical protein